MQMRMKLRKLRALRGRVGSLVCKRCKTGNLFALWEGGLCARCYVPKPVDPNSAVRRSVYLQNEPRPQSDATLALVKKAKALVKARGVTKAEFAEALGVDKAMFYRWESGLLGTRGQANMAARVELCIRAFRAEVAS